TYIEEIIQKAPKSATPFSSSSSQRAAKPHKLNDIERLEERRIMLKDMEMNRVLGGGIVPGSLILFGGEPGIGKSTLLLQLSVSEVDKTILYISGEESEQQVSMRADRIGSKNENCYVLTETSIENIFIQLEAVKPDLLVI